MSLTLLDLALYGLLAVPLFGTAVALLLQLFGRRPAPLADPVLHLPRAAEEAEAAQPARDALKQARQPGRRPSAPSGAGPDMTADAASSRSPLSKSA